MVRKIVCTVGMVITQVKGVLVANAFFFPQTTSAFSVTWLSLLAVVHMLP